MQLPNNLVTALLGTNPGEMKAYFHTKICIQMFIAHLLVTVKKGKQFNCPSIGKWLNLPLSVIPWIVAHQAPLSTELPRQEYWRGLPFLLQEIGPESPASPALAGGFCTTLPLVKPMVHPYYGIFRRSDVTESCPTLCNPTDCNLPGSSIHGIFQARIL